MLSLVAYQSSEESESDTEETSNVALPSKQSENDSCDLKNGTPSLSATIPAKSKEPVRITVPSLKQFEDDEKDEPSSKKIKKSSGSGLISMLPPPKYSKPAASQKPFVPYILTKKKTSSRPSRPIIAGSAHNSDSVEPSKIPTTCNKPLAKTEHHSEKELAVVEKDHSPVADFFSLGKPKSESNFSVPVSHEVMKPEGKNYEITGDVLQTNNLPEVSSVSSENSSSSFWESQSENNAAAQYSESVSHSESYAAESSCADHSVNDFYAGYPEIGPSTEKYVADEGFLRLQGKRKGQEEINIIDVSVDDQLSDKTEWLTKSITEEKVHRSSRKKNDMPTQLQKRKHQITYLAFQAKERELELKNQWSQNRLTKRETQAKYGF